MVAVATLQTRQEAEILKGFLESQGITSFITADDRGGATPFPFAPTPEGVKLFVKEEDREKATILLEQKNSS